MRPAFNPPPRAPSLPGSGQWSILTAPLPLPRPSPLLPSSLPHGYTHTGGETGLGSPANTKHTHTSHTPRTHAQVYIWDAATCKMQYKLPGHAGSVNECVFHPVEPIIASASSDKTLFLGELMR